MTAPLALSLHDLLEVCASPLWAQRVLASGPFPDVDAVLDAADRALADLPDAQIDAALAGHPRIGERAEQPSSRREQAGMADADDALRAAIAAGNQAYEARFGHVYLVCASGLSAAQLLAKLDERLTNDAATERAVVRDELGAINRLRLRRLLSSAGASS
jgi:2-oxo-4-hydroxy-4-carboxy-5-ureidoimidazoline decarboxylase